MISIEINNQYLILSPDTTIKLSLVFPNPTADTLQSSVVQWFTIPSTDVNDKILTYSKSLDISSKIRIYDNVILRIGGDMSFRGTMLVQTTTAREYKVAFSFRPFPEAFKDTNIRDIAYADYYIGADTSEIITSAKAASVLAYPDTDFVFPKIEAKNFYAEEINPSFNKFINHYANGNYLKNFFFQLSVYNQNCLVPHFFLKSVLTSIFADIGYTVQGKFMDDVQFSKLVLFNNFALDFTPKAEDIAQGNTTTERNFEIFAYGEYVYYTPIEIDSETDPYNLLNLATSDYTVDKEGGISVSIKLDAKITSVQGYDAQQQLVLAIVRNNDWYDKVRIDLPVADMNYSYFDAYLNFPDIAIGDTLTAYIGLYKVVSGRTYNIYYNNAEIIYNPISYNNLNFFTGDISPKNHVPNISVSEFLNTIVKAFCLAPFVDTQRSIISLDSWNDIIDSPKQLDLTEYYILDTQEIELLKSEYKLKLADTDEINQQLTSKYTLLGTITSGDITAPTGPNQMYYVENLNKYILSYYDNTAQLYMWKNYRDNFENINSEKSNAELIEIDITPMRMRFNEAYTAQNMLPATDISGTSPAFGTGEYEFKFSLLHYFGIIPNRVTNQPTASVGRYDTAGNIHADFALRLNGADGMYEKFQRKYYDYIAEREQVKLNLNLDMLGVARIMRLFETDSDTRKVRIINRNYIPILFDIEISMNGRIQTLATLI